jgi:hypothetical protein
MRRVLRDDFVRWKAVAKPARAQGRAMRRFRDGSGADWDVVLGRESWGALYALFVPAVTGAAPVRQTALRAVAYDAAMQELEQLDEAALQALFERSTIKDEGT